MKIIDGLRRRAALFCTSLALFSPVTIRADEGALPSKVDTSRWQDFVSKGGRYKVAFPSYPQHVSETLKMQNGRVSIKYDAYIAEQGVDALYMVLIAQYPKTQVRPDPEAGLKAFLNGLLSHGESSRLVQVDWQEFQGFSSVDFLINTAGILLQGRAVMVDNSLYLVAMESHETRFCTENFQYFIETFAIVKD